jgi:long-chain acyl-CoA synthetase
MAVPMPWLAHYDSGVPASLAPYPAITLLDRVSELARERPDSAAILFKGATVTWGQIEQESDALAVGLGEIGVARGERVALLLPNCPQFVVAQLAIWKLGAVVAPLSPIYTEHEIAKALQENGVDTIITMTRFYDRVKAAQPHTVLRRVIATNIKEHFPPLLRLLFTLLREKKDGDRITLAPGDFRFRELIERHRGQSPVRARLTPEDPAVLLMSGGTTGLPKGVLGTHATYVRTGLQVGAWTAPLLGREPSIILLPLPLFHVYSNVGVQGFAIMTGSVLALVPNPRDLPDLLATIRRVKPTFFTGVPTLYVALLGHKDVQGGKVDFKSIKVCFSGAAALMAETKARFESLTGGRLIEGYSLTEAMMALCVNPVVGANKIGSVGMPLPDVRVAIFDGDEGVRLMPTGEVGEICFARDPLMVGFWNRPDETAAVLREHVEDDGTPSQWVHTGDLGYLDPDGYLFIVDRKKDLIKSSGFQVWPREVEEVLSAHPAVAEAGVAGIADEAKGEAIHAWVVLRAGHSTDEETLRTYCREKLSAYKVPSKVHFRKELPKTMVGKVLRRALKDSKP